MAAFAPQSRASAINHRQPIRWRGEKSAMANPTMSSAAAIRCAFDENGMPENGERHGPGRTANRARSINAAHKRQRSVRTESGLIISSTDGRLCHGPLISPVEAADVQWRHRMPCYYPEVSE